MPELLIKYKGYMLFILSRFIQCAGMQLDKKSNVPKSEPQLNNLEFCHTELVEIENDKNSNIIYDALSFNFYSLYTIRESVNNDDNPLSNRDQDDADLTDVFENKEPYDPENSNDEIVEINLLNENVDVSEESEKDAELAIGPEISPDILKPNTIKRYLSKNLYKSLIFCENKTGFPNHDMYIKFNSSKTASKSAKAYILEIKMNNFNERKDLNKTLGNLFSIYLQEYDKNLTQIDFSVENDESIIRIAFPRSTDFKNMYVRLVHVGYLNSINTDNMKIKTTKNKATSAVVKEELISDVTITNKYLEDNNMYKAQVTIPKGYEIYTYENKIANVTKVSDNYFKVLKNTLENSNCDSDHCNLKKLFAVKHRLNYREKYVKKLRAEQKLFSTYQKYSRCNGSEKNYATDDSDSNENVSIADKYYKNIASTIFLKYTEFVTTLLPCIEFISTKKNIKSNEYREYNRLKYTCSKADNKQEVFQVCFSVLFRCLIENCKGWTSITHSFSSIFNVVSKPSCLFNLINNSNTKFYEINVNDTKLLKDYFVGCKNDNKKHASEMLCKLSETNMAIDELLIKEDSENIPGVNSSIKEDLEDMSSVDSDDKKDSKKTESKSWLSQNKVLVGGIVITIVIIGAGATALILM